MLLVLIDGKAKKATLFQALREGDKVHADGFIFEAQITAQSLTVFLEAVPAKAIAFVGTFQKFFKKTMNRYSILLV